ncbi:MAG: methyltransferase domain-containing protein [Silicimonas sp.]|nr:methyltransferase domain-containing protein [Silicimonas sp.]
MADNPDLESAYALETPEDNLKLYRDWADTYDAEFVDATTYRFPRVVTRTYLDAGGVWPCLDVGCGTGALAVHFPADALIDGIDLSPDMLGVAARKGRYRNLIEANLKETLPIEDAAYNGLVSSGTFTHGHVGPEALPELIRCLAPEAVAVMTVRPQIWRDQLFAPAFGALAEAGAITEPEVLEERVYADSDAAPEGHGDDTGYIVTFRRQ